MLFYVYLALSLALGTAAGTAMPFFNSPGDIWVIPLLGLGFFLCFLILHALFLVIIARFVDDTKPIKKVSVFFQYVVKYTMSLVLKVMRVRVKITGRELLPADERYLLVCNHRFFADPLPLMAMMKKPELAFIMKLAVRKMAFIGKCGYMCGGLYINRDDAREAVSTINRASEILSWGTTSMCIFPEGGTNHAEELKPMRNGAFKIAKKAGSPIVVTAMRNTDYILKRYPLRSTLVPVVVCGVIDAEFVKSHTTVEIGRLVTEMMEQGLAKIEAEYEVYRT